MPARATRVSRRHLTASLALLLLVVTARTRAQTSAPETLHVYSRETVVDITVTDDQGNHVSNLGRSDFTIQEDDKPQPIRSFKETHASRAAILPAKLPPGTYTSAQTTPAAGPVTVILIDSLNSPGLGAT